MATWWRRIVYSTVFKVLMGIGVGISTCIFFYSIIGFGELPEGTKSYVDTEDFRHEFIQKAGYLRDWIVRYDEDTIFTDISKQDIEAYIKNDGRGLSEKEAIEGIVRDRNNYYNTIQNELIHNNKNIDFIAVDTQKNRQITNMGSDKSAASIINELCSRSTCLIGNGYYVLQVNYGIDNYNSYYNGHYFTDNEYYTGDSFAGQDNYRVYIALKDQLVEGDEFYTGYMSFRARQEQSQNSFKYLLASVGLGLAFIFLWLIVVGRKPEHAGITMLAFDKVVFEVQLGLFVLCSALFINGLEQFREYVERVDGFYIMGKNLDEMVLQAVLLSLIVFTYIIVALAITSSWVRHFKNHTMLQHIWSIRTIGDIYHHIFGEKNLVVVTLGITAIYMVVNAFAIRGMIMRDVGAYLPFVFLVVWNVFFAACVLKLILGYKAILKVAKDISKGQLNKKVDLGRTVPILSEMAETVNSMGTGLEKAVDTSIKSERFKTELITNVSHDLKTPLTSIISYIDLLKDEKIENKVANEYIEVLDERSHRLKQLVEDLVEASKVVTGNVRVQLEPLRLDELVRQAVGEYSDRIEASALTITMNQMEEVCIMGDGRHMWRIIENLLSNVSKYAMPHTRVYIQVENKEDYGCFIIKNISRDPLNINPEELTERFVRGDSSRTTEGTGLGLAIAQSLVTLQNGKLDIAIDGDLFKVQVEIPSTTGDIQDDFLENKPLKKK